MQIKEIAGARPVVPHPEKLRPWVQDCLAVLGVSAASVSRDLGLGRNTIGDFLARPGRDIAMTTAHGLTCRINEIAIDKAVSLPRIGDRNAR